jgi:rubrerythrin
MTRLIVYIRSRITEGCAGMGMKEIIELAGETLGLFKATAELVKGVREAAATSQPERKQLIDTAVEALRDKMTELQDKHVALQQIALAAAQLNIEILEENRTLKEKMAKLDKFEAERHLFERVTLALNTAAYREKSFDGAADAQPLFCPACFENSKKTYLNFHEHAMHTKHMKCPACGTGVHVARDEGSAVKIGRVRSRRDLFEDY